MSRGHKVYGTKLPSTCQAIRLGKWNLKNQECRQIYLLSISEGKKVKLVLWLACKSGLIVIQFRMALETSLRSITISLTYFCLGNQAIGLHGPSPLNLHATAKGPVPEQNFPPPQKLLNSASKVPLDSWNATIAHTCTGFPRTTSLLEPNPYVMPGGWGQNMQAPTQLWNVVSSPMECL